MEKAHESLAAGRSEYRSGRLTTAVRNLYYACFYSLTALLLEKGRSFKKHTGVKAALHKNLIKERGPQDCPNESDGLTDEVPAYPNALLLPRSW